MFRMILVGFLTLAGLLVFFRINPVTVLTEAFTKSADKTTMRSMHEDAVGKKRKHRLFGWLYEMKDMLDTTERGDQFEHYCRLCATLCLGGLVVGILLTNYLLAVILAAAGILIPVFSLRRSTTAYTKDVNGEYESSLLVINTSYMRTDNIDVAVEENIPYINPPVQQLFVRFLAQRRAGYSVVKALLELKGSVRNPVFKEWCDAMILCSTDHTMKHMLDPVVSKLTDISSVQAEMDAKIAKPVSETVAVMIIVLALIPSMYFLNVDWFISLFTTLAGKIALSIVAATELYALMRIIRVMRPLEEEAESK